MINNEIKQLVRDMKIETVADTGTFQELESIAAELLNSNDTGNKLLAMRIQARLNENPNYLDFVKRAEIEQEVKETENDHKIAKQQEIRQVNATANVEHRKREENKAKYEEDKKVTEAFNKLTFEQQKMIIELEKSFKPEVQQELRAYLLDKEKSTPENFARIMNKEIGNDVVKIEKSDDGKEFITTDEKTITTEAKEVSEKSEKVADTAFKAGNVDAGVVAASTMDAANVRVATNNTKEAIEKIENEGDAWTSKDAFANMTEQQKDSYLKGAAVQKFVNLDLTEKVLPKHFEKVNKLENANLSEEEKKNKIDGYNEVLTKNIKKGLKENNVDLNNEADRNSFISTLSNNANIPEEQKNVIVEKLGIKQAYEKHKKEQEDVAAEIDAADIDSKPKPVPETKKAEEKEVKVYDPTVDGQKQRDGIQYEANKRMRAEYNPAALRKNEEIYVAVNHSATSESNSN